MANETTITIIGNLVADPEVRFLNDGTTVANFRVASTPRKFNKQTNQWEDGEALFLTVNVWRQMAENVAQSLTKGMSVMVMGALKQRSYETTEGEKRTVFEIEAEEVGPSLRFATAQVQRSQSGQNNQGGQQQGGFGGQQQQQGQQGGFNNQGGGQAQQGGFGQAQGQQDAFGGQQQQGGFGGQQPGF